MMAMNQVLADNPPDLLLPGVNRGANMGEDVAYSGTIAAAMEGTLVGVPSIALSQSLPTARVCIGPRLSNMLATSSAVWLPSAGLGMY